MANFTATNSPVLDCLPGATVKVESATWPTTGASGPWQTDVAADPQIFEIDYIRISQAQVLTGAAPI